MRISRGAFACCGLASLLAVVATLTPAAPAADRVELELATEKGFPIEGAHEWMRALRDVGATVRIRGENPGDEPTIRTRGAGESQTHVVVGILTSREVLLLPGGRFTIRDVERIRQWVASLKDEGVEGVTAARGAFGLTTDQLLEVHKELSSPVGVSTQGVAVRKSLSAITSGLGVKVVVAPGALDGVPQEETTRDELKDLTAGTALAAALRPHALAFAPRRSAGGGLELYVARATALEEAWPVGWPAEKPLKDAAPNLFKFLKVEIEDTLLSDALAAVGGRMETPLLYDYNGLARERIDPARIKVSLPAERTYYKKLIDRMLFQARLKSEVRLDEADRAFLWISTLRD